MALSHVGKKTATFALNGVNDAEDADNEEDEDDEKDEDAWMQTDFAFRPLKHHPLVSPCLCFRLCHFYLILSIQFH